MRACVIALAALLPFFPSNSYGWHAKTHKYLAQRAAEFLVDKEEGDFYKRHIDDLLRGAVEADSGWRNTKHHITFLNGEVYSDVAARFAEELGEEAVDIIHDARIKGHVTEEEETEFAKICGYIVHVITDIGNSYHVIWGEDNSEHGKYESGVDNTVTMTRNGDLESRGFRVNFDGRMRGGVDPYNAVMEVAETTYFGSVTILPAEDIEREMETNNSDAETWNGEVRKSTKMSMRKATNVAAEVLSQLHKRAFFDPLPDTTDIPDTTILQTETTKQTQE
ncbi:MAG: zinc dependent phospholipase C family protein [Candidatus Aenigmarchaeota archaeon]|nr:zinc dependent phospholipase C family protein [Candidatus Aenigmarchaeota archaeon]